MPHLLIGRHDGVYRMAYREWGDPANPDVVVLAHGLTHNGQVFATLAQALAQRYRVVVPDVVGRGDSDWLRDPMGYQPAFYVQDMLALVARLGVERVDWLGTSMGGLIGMLLAALPGTPVRRLILNDVGPTLSREAIARIGGYVGKAPLFATPEQAEAYLRTVCASCGQHSDAQWAELTQAMFAPSAGGWKIRYDPAIAVPFQHGANGDDLDLWGHYERIAGPVLVLRGETSDLLSRETAAAMRQRLPQTRVEEVPGVGHAPLFMHAEQIERVMHFLCSGK